MEVVINRTLKSSVPVSRAASRAWRKMYEPHHHWKLDISISAPDKKPLFGVSQTVCRSEVTAAFWCAGVTFKCCLLSFPV